MDDSSVRCTPVHIIEAKTSRDMDKVRRLFQEYAASFDFSLCFQDFTGELETLPGNYAPPGGHLLLAQTENREAAGVVALRPLDESRTCEMKRLYVRPGYRGQGIGRRLTEALIEDARRKGYRRVRLDTITGKMDEAIRLYRSLGFIEIPPYCHNPISEARYFELVLYPWHV
jgi:ribosomal protein S18 acetylase RimI-like enzyme